MDVIKQGVKTNIFLKRFGQSLKNNILFKIDFTTLKNTKLFITVQHMQYLYQRILILLKFR